jgi:pimeloyl-ACP methyl ester carboxylesterase
VSEFGTVQLRVHGDPARPTLIYLPGLHGDWTLVSSFRAAVAGRVRFVEFTYPCRTDWSLEDYAHGAMEQLAAHGITRGWLLAESFGSQVAWSLLQRVDTKFEPLGVIFAGGFVRHPIIWGVHLFRFFQRWLPWPCFQLLLKFYACYARFRHRQAPETLAAIDEFVRRRTRADNLAIASRYPLIARADFRDMARRTTLPVFALTGFFDPIVAWPLVHPWLRKNCPGFRARRIIFNADHNVLATTPQKSAEQILRWMQDA